MTGGVGDPDTAARRTRTDLRSFGRRHGRTLSPRQQHLLSTQLPRFGLDLNAPPPDALTDLFAVPVDEIWLEIGFGGAEHMLWQAGRHPEVGIIGCEPYQDGIVKALSAIETKGVRNIRLWPDDARPLLDWLPPRSISRAFVLFPDPWPKKRHAKRRLLSAATVALIAERMAPRAELRIATDIADYVRTALIAVAGTPQLVWTARDPGDWRERPDDWPPTRYEAKALREGRRCYFFRLCKAAAAVLK